MQEKLDDFLNNKPKELAELENDTLSRIECSGQVLANIALLNVRKLDAPFAIMIQCH